MLIGWRLKLIINICKEPLHYYEFVKPIEDIVKEKAIHYKDVKDISKEDYIIICGTSLRDNDYLKHDLFFCFFSLLMFRQYNI